MFKREGVIEGKRAAFLVNNLSVFFYETKNITFAGYIAQNSVKKNFN